LKVLEKENSLESRMALFPKNTQYPFFGEVIGPLSMLNNSSGQPLFSEDTLIKLNVAFVLSYGQMKEGEITDELKQQLNNALEGLARGNQNAAQKLAVETKDPKDPRLFNFLIKAKNILMPAKGGLRKTRGRRLAKKTRRLAKKTRRS
jgi:hypothetical protein